MKDENSSKTPGKIRSIFRSLRVEISKDSGNFHSAPFQVKAYGGFQELNGQSQLSCSSRGLDVPLPTCYSHSWKCRICCVYKWTLRGHYGAPSPYTHSGVRERVVSKRVVLAGVPAPQNRNEGRQTGTRVQKPVFLDPKNPNEGTKTEQGHIRQNRPFVSSRHMSPCFNILCTTTSQRESIECFYAHQFVHWPVAPPEDLRFFQ